jgi:PhoH-like ATPase
MNTKTIKNIVLDTSVLLYDKNAIHKFGENNIYIPLVVLEEIDRKKSSPGVLGENARYVNRLLDDLRSLGKLHQGVDFGEGLLYIVKEYDQSVLDYSTSHDNDTKIIACCKYIDENTDNPVVLVTKDLNLRVRADTFNIQSNDFYVEYEDVDTNWVGWRNYETDVSLINKVYKDCTVPVDGSFHQNEFVVLKDNTSGGSALTQFRIGNLNLLPNKDECKKQTGCIPKNKEQQFALNLMSSITTPLVTLTGMPGSGKTYLAFMTGIELVSKGIYERIIYTRPLQQVGKEMGFLPGTLEEKFGPYLAPIEDNFQNAFGNLDYFRLMMDKGQIDIAPISYIRGRSFKNSFVIVDEAQNATVHELKTIITRIGENSKVVLIGDTKQIDNPYLTDESNGLTIIADKFKNSVLSGHVHFTKGYRSPLASEADKLLE